MISFGIMLNRVHSGICRIVRRSKVIAHKVFKTFWVLNYSVEDSGNNGWLDSGWKFIVMRL